MPLNDHNATVKPGRLPDNERVSLEALLKGNGFTDEDCQKACSADAHATDLNTRFGRVAALEGRFDKNPSAQKRRQLRRELESEYDYLLDAAQRYVDDADTAYKAAVEAQVDQLRQENPTKNEMYMNIWTDRSARIVPDARLAKWVQAAAFRLEIRARYKAKYNPVAAPVSQLSQADQQALQTEKNNITAQLTAWATTPDGATGCNDIGTWGTSAGGAGTSFAVSQVNRRVWAELVTWWRGKENTYVTLSDTSHRSLKKFRDVNDGRSRTINYHLNVT
ncbi:hypothetical protein SAMN05421504_101799 [Amycolatopsis xylanica]|uniref:Uncharacterized protein n=1 Tax=Amycolatopsis xylanica TaxID=589385 RepID=A0A1H2U8I8_9PSEU|nr:hypothetical protein [Amycolatopsis xylanica]SDW51754.1 hypothetical protein SAMN05421504_101799 [Amycolatopsis xylanica]